MVSRGPVGQNDAITWPEFAGLLAGSNPAAIERHLKSLKHSGVTVLRFMLEYCEHGSAFLESPAGTFNEQLARVWDELVALCRRVGLRLLLTPFDTFFTWTNWDAHPYNRANGGPCAGRDRLLTCAATRSFIKRRLEFATRRWGGDGVVFAWDLWNELHPAQGEDRPDLLRGLHRRRRPVAALPRAASCTAAPTCRPSRCSGRSWSGSRG